MATAAPQHQKFDILVAGAGASGLIAAIALARTGHSVALVGKTPGPLPGRTVALFEGSLRHLDDLGLREPLRGNFGDREGHPHHRRHVVAVPPAAGAVHFR
ncbi:MAG: FAD-binding protein [Methylobacteriaceae bacterium]|nr:FAD-binding protein [Methylobacteriaceae bacterium]